MKNSRYFGLALAAALLACSNSGFRVASQKPRAAEKYSKEILRAMDRAPAEPAKAWIYLTDKPASVEATRAPSYLEKLDRPVHEEYRTEIERQGARIRNTSRWLNAVSVEANPDVLSALGDLSFVLRIEQVKGTKSVPKEPEPSRAVEEASEEESPVPSSSASDYGPSFEQVAQIGVLPLHQKGLSGRGITIALLDAGFHKDHESLKRVRLLGERDFVFEDDDVEQDPNNPKDFDDRHGTEVWSVIAGYAPRQLIGPAFGASYLLAKTENLPSETPEEEDHWVAGVEWAKENRAKIISSSLGYTVFDDKTSHPYSSLNGETLATARIANVAAQFGILIVNAVGNEGQDKETGQIRLGSLASPADAFGVLAVGAVTGEGLIAGFSSRGPTYDGRIKPDVVARGVAVYAATNEGADGYAHDDGTSFAAPLVAGVAALLWEAHPDWNLDQLKEALRNTASQAERPDNHYGYGIVNAEAALNYKPILPPLAYLP